MIDVRQLVKWYGPRLALDRVSFQAERGRIVGFLGPNGAGKTTTLRILTCFMPASEGAATVNGHDIATQPDLVRRAVGYLPENTPLYPELRVEEHLHHFGKLHGVDRATRNSRIDQLTEQCGLQQIRHRPIGQLSKGNKQRVGLAQALLHDPPVLILDEPTAGLDPAQITHIRELIRQLGREKTVLLSTHILPEVEKTCDEVVIIHEGRVVGSGTPDSLVEKHQKRGSVAIVEVRAEPDEVRRVLGAIDAVRDVDVSKSDEWCRARIAAHGDQDIREAIGKTITAHRWQVRELRIEGGTLEEIFIALTSRHSEGEAA